MSPDVTPLFKGKGLGWPKKSSYAKRKGYSQSWNWTMERAGWRCEVVLDGKRCTSRATQCHHIVPRSRGRDDDMANLLAVCAPHHSWIHEHPEESTLRGYLRSRNGGDAA